MLTFEIQMYGLKAICTIKMKINLQIGHLFSRLLREKDFMVSSGFEEKFQINQGLFFVVL